jgi:hypothetical protein
MDLAIFFEIWVIWCFQFKLLSSITPRNLVVFTISRVVCPILISTLSKLGLFFGPKIIMWVLSAFNDKRFAHNQSIKSGISRLICFVMSIKLGPDENKLESSRNIMVVNLFVNNPRSLIYKRNSIGPKIEPSGTPHVILEIDEFFPL